MTLYVATINTPGYLPENDEPDVFDTPGEAWAYLRDARERAEDLFAEDDETPYSDTYQYLRARARFATKIPTWFGATGTLYGDTPGYWGNHDLGEAYSVNVYTGDDPRDSADS